MQYLYPVFNILLFFHLTEATPPLPFVVSIQKIEENLFQPICVGGIIHKKFVLTAAHCFENDRNVSKLSVAGGSKHLSHQRNHLRREVVRILTHMKYIPLFGYDIALVEVAPEFDFSDHRFGKLNYQNVRESEWLFLCGWGGHHKDLQMVSFKLFPRDRCRNSGFHYVTNSEICAYSPAGRGACDGDSGGPLISEDFKEVVGVLSYGKTPCKPKRIFSFTRVKTLEPWIKSEISNALSGYYKKGGIWAT